MSTNNLTSANTVLAYTSLYVIVFYFWSSKTYSERNIEYLGHSKAINSLELVQRLWWCGGMVVWWCGGMVVWWWGGMVVWRCKPILVFSLAQAEQLLLVSK